MNENYDDSVPINDLVYFIPGELVLLVLHAADIVESDPHLFEEKLVAYLSDIPELRGGTYSDLVIERLHDPDQRRLSVLRTNSESLSTLTLDTGLPYNELILTIEELNNRLRERRSEDDFGSIRASFNWLSNLSQGSTHTVGGPGAKPVAIDRATAEAELDTEISTVLKFLATLPPAFQTIKYPIVNIAILDTVPPLPLLAARLNQLVLSSSSPHPLAELLGTSPTFDMQLNDAGDFLIVKGSKLPNPDLSFQMSYNLMPHYRSRLLMDVLNSGDKSVDVFDHAYKMVDHGLFIAGTISRFLSRIISDLSLKLHVNIHLIQVLNDYGVGTVDSLVRGLNWAVNNPDVQKRQPLVINCSLTLTTPRDGHVMYFDSMEGEERGNLNDHSRSYLRQFFAEKSDQADDMFTPIAEVISQLYSEDVSIAAAAGNESRGSSRKKNARFPAAFKEIMGVGATSSKGNPTDYTNQRDIPPSAGADAVGGEVEEVGGEIFSTKGVPGWYIGDIPKSARNANPTPSPSGWARWAGTSFATPRIALRMALLRAHGLSKQRVQGMLDKDATTP